MHAPFSVCAAGHTSARNVHAQHWLRKTVDGAKNTPRQRGRKTEHAARLERGDKLRLLAAYLATHPDGLADAAKR